MELKATIIKDKLLDKIGSSPAPKEWRSIKAVEEVLPKSRRISAFLQKLDGKDICVWMYPNGRGYIYTCSDYLLIEQRIMPMQDKLADKWAVEITCPRDAERLQALFPEDTTHIGRSLIESYEAIHQSAYFENTICFSKHGTWGHLTRLFYEEEGYTIYTITELENLLK